MTVDFPYPGYEKINPAEVPDLPGVLAYGQTRQEAIERVQVLSLRVLADRLDHGEPVPQVSGVFAVTP